MSERFDVLIKYLPSLLLYICFITGLIVLFSDDFYLLYKRITMFRRLNISVVKESNPFFELLGSLVSSSVKRSIRGETAAACLLLLFSVCFLLASRNLGFLPSAVTAAFVTAIPILIFYARLQRQRGKGGGEGLAFVSELNRCYRIENKNIYEALERCSSRENNFPVCSLQAYKLLIHLRSASSCNEQRAAIKQFAFSIGTVWAGMLAGSIRACIEKGTDISNGLSDIVEQLERANSRREERKRLNSESVRMTVFLVPILYIGTVFMSSKYLGVSLKTYLANQFLTNEGLIFFVVIVFLFLVNIILIGFVSNIPADL